MRSYDGYVRTSEEDRLGLAGDEVGMVISPGAVMLPQRSTTVDGAKIAEAKVLIDKSRSVGASDSYPTRRTGT